MTVDNVQDIYKLSPVQHGMLFHTLYAPEAGAYFYQFVLPFGALHGEQVKQAWQRLVDRHTVLRTSFMWEDLDEPVQIVHTKVTLSILEEDWSHLEPDQQRTRLAAYCREDRRRGFDLTQAPVMRVTVIRMSPEDHQVVWSYHHLILDGWSMSLVMRELITLYQAALLGRPPQLAPPRPFRDYIRWLGQQDLAKAEAYWHRTLEGISGPTPLAIDLAPGRPPGPDESYRVVKLNVEGEAHQRLKSLCRQHRLTIANVVQGAWALMLGRYSGRTDLVFGITVSGRPAEIPGVETMIGNFINTLPARAHIEDGEEVVAWLQRLQREQLERKQYEYSPLVDIRTWCQLPADQPLFEAILVFERYGLATPGRAATGEKRQEREEREEPESFQRTNYPLAAVVRPKEDALGLSIGYDRSRFETAAMERMLHHMAMLLQAFTEGDETTLGALPALPAEEERQLLAWNDTAADYPAETPVHTLVAAQAEKAPQSPAVTFAGETLTYGGLQARAERLAHHLRAHGVGEEGGETLVGLCLERSADMVVAALAVLNAGGAYVPLDPAYPAERLAFVVEDAGIRTLLTQAHLRDLLPGEGVERLLLDDGSLDGEPATPSPLPAVAAERLAYVIYTSGSTGRPKGVQITHRCFANFLHTMRQRPGLTARDVLLAVTTLSFDIAGLELFLPLTTGAQVVVAAQEDTLDGRRLGALLAATGSTVMQATPATWRLLLQSGWGGRPGLRVLCGGEALPRDLAEQLLASGVNLWNVYGPTETTVWSTTTEVAPGDGPVTIGRPIANTTLYTLDRRGAPAPIGVPGELMIGGHGVARGYLGRPGLTAERFVPDPFAASAGTRLYRTGDLARWRSDGDLDFLGRLDHQVKVRGFRIELGEIESALATHPAVAQNAVLAREDTPGDQRLVAYVVPREGGLPAPPVLRGFLQRTLPDYMVPSVFVELEALPLTPNGKVDRRALPAPEGSRRDAGRTVAPRSDAEKAIAAVWREVLGLDAVGIDESFFDLGGHSLLMVKVHNKLRAHFDRDIDMVDLFRFPTIEALGRHLSGEASADEQAAALRVRIRRATTGGEVAIVGMAGRFPGAPDLDTFWANLREGLETTTFFSDEELREAGVDEALLANPRYVKARPMLAEADWFDADFFDYTPREAQILDPQQRVFLECAWEALESAGHDFEDRSRDVAVFAGAALNTHLMRFFANPALARSVGSYQVFISNDKDFLATRVSYKLDLTGPSINVQTACSTALVGVCLACDSLLSGQSDVALAGGVSVKASQPSGYLFEPGGIVAPDGHTRTFDARGRGTIFGDGVGVVVLKRLEDALADGDTIHAVVKGAALNNDGAHKVGFTAPSVEGQARAILSAQAQAGVGPEEIGYIEAHGTGTELGDPIEVTALTQAFRRGSGGNGTDQTGYCALGSVKSNFGHLDTAAGVAGLIKAVLSLEHEAIPPSLGFDTPNPLIDFAASPFFVNTALRPWPRNETPRRAGVSSFGIGGTNAHVIVEEAPLRPASADAAPWHLLLLSAKTATARDAMTARLGAHLAAHPAINLADVAFTLQAGRRDFPYRRAVVCRDVEDAITALGSGEGDEAGRWVDAQQSASGRPVAFLFPGQGTQHVGMGRELYESEAVFRQQVDAACEILAPHLDLDLRVLLYPAAGEEDEAAAQLAETRYTQPALFVISHACARLWMSWGLKPAAMLGHSIGEYVAACLAGVFTLEDALALVAARGSLMQTLPAGAMLSVGLGAADLETRLGSEHGAALDLAAVNGPELCVVSGPGAAVEAFHQALQEEGIDCRPLHTSHAFHSAMMEPILDTFRDRVEAVPRQAPTRRYLSNVSGTWITAEEAVDPDYWSRHLRSAVRFADGLEVLLQEGDGALLEVGPGRALATLARRHPGRQPEHAIITSLPHPKEPQGARPFLLGALGRLWLAGVGCDWAAVHGNVPRRRLPLPTYPFERRRFWIEIPRSSTSASETADASAMLRASPAVAQPDEDGAAVPYAAPRDERERAIAALWEELIGSERVGIHDNYFEIGGTSLLAVRLAARLRDLFGLELSPHFLLEAQTVAALAAHIGAALEDGERDADDADQAAAAGPSCLVTLQAGDDDGRRPLFLAHPVGGRVYFYRGLAAALGADQAVYGLRAHGIVAGEEPLDTIEEMASAYVEAIRWRQPAGPYLLGGSSMGGIVAYEIAQQLHAAGERVDLLAMLDAPGRGHMPAPADDDAELLHRMFSRQAGISLAALRERQGDDQLRYLVERGRASGTVPPEFTLEDAQRLLKVHKNATRAMLAYEPKPYPGTALYFRAQERRDFETANPEAAWIDLVAGGTEVHIVPGDHITMHFEPHLPALAARLRRALDRAHGPTT